MFLNTKNAKYKDKSSKLKLIHKSKRNIFEITTESDFKSFVQTISDNFLYTILFLHVLYKKNENFLMF